MAGDNILLEMSVEKTRLVRELMIKVLGHEPSNDEKKDFTIMHNLYESLIYYKGELIGTLQFQTVDNSAI